MENDAIAFPTQFATDIVGNGSVWYPQVIISVKHSLTRCRGPGRKERFSRSVTLPAHQYLTQFTNGKSKKEKKIERAHKMEWMLFSEAPLVEGRAPAEPWAAPRRAS